MTTSEKWILYKAVKHEVATYLMDHGFTLPDMWKAVNSDSDHGHFWKTECIRDYEHDCK